MGQMLNMLLQERSREKMLQDNLLGVSKQVASSGMPTVNAQGGAEMQQTAKGLLAGGMDQNQAFEQIFNNPRYNPQSVSLMDQQALAQSDAAMARTQAGEDRQQLMQMDALKLQEKQQAIETNAQTLARGGFSAKEMATANREISGLARAIGSNKEVSRIMNMDENLYKGGAAATVGYIQKTQIPAIMTAINTGVINSPSEQERVDSYLATVRGWKGGTTLSSTQKAEVAEFTRWFENQVIDYADAYNLDTAQWADKAEGRSQAELYDTIESYRTTVDEADANSSDLTKLGSGAAIPLDEQQAIREQQGGFPGVVPAVKDAYGWYRGDDWSPE